MLDGSQNSEPPAGDDAPGRGLNRRSTRQTLDIGLVNNMPDSALQATELQFATLLEAAAGAELNVRLHLLSLSGVKRSAATAAAMRGRYRDAANLDELKLDALIVTGTEPRSSFLPDEPYWQALADLAEWAKDNVASAVWSCLAAHAMTQYADHIERRPIGAKRVGVFDCEVVGVHPLLAGLPDQIRTPHSRYNELPEEDLVRAGYSVLTRSPTAGVDLFAKTQGRCLFVYFQGHPEYGPESLWREYRRDIAQYLSFERAEYPPLPLNYFSPEDFRKCRAFEARAKANRNAALVADLFQLGIQAPSAQSWRASATLVYRNWLKQLVERARTPAPLSLSRMETR